LASRIEAIATSSVSGTEFRFYSLKIRFSRSGSRAFRFALVVDHTPNLCNKKLLVSVSVAPLAAASARMHVNAAAAAGKDV
jgi:hypothetical protein